jgi:hypothetical protein
VNPGKDPIKEDKIKLINQLLALPVRGDAMAWDDWNRRSVGGLQLHRLF